MTIEKNRPTHALNTLIVRHNSEHKNSTMEGNLKAVEEVNDFRKLDTLESLIIFGIVKKKYQR